MDCLHGLPWLSQFSGPTQKAWARRPFSPLRWLKAKHKHFWASALLWGTPLGRVHFLSKHPLSPLYVLWGNILQSTSIFLECYPYNLNFTKFIDLFHSACITFADSNTLICFLISEMPSFGGKWRVEGMEKNGKIPKISLAAIAAILLGAQRGDGEFFTWSFWWFTMNK